MQTLAELEKRWENSVEFCKYVHETFCDLVDAEFKLKALRDWVEKNFWGMGERSFYWMWKLICQELPTDARLLEIGVHRGQTLALWRTLMPEAEVFGLSPFDGTDVGEKRDYREDVFFIFNEFGLKPPRLLCGYSDHPQSIVEASVKFSDGLDVLYIDGGHSYETTKSDILNYATLIKPGGYLVIDDSANRDFKHHWGYFMGIPTVSKAVDNLLPPYGKSEIGNQFDHLFNVVHNRVWIKRN